MSDHTCSRWIAHLLLAFCLAAISLGLALFASFPSPVRADAFPPVITTNLSPPFPNLIYTVTNTNDSGVGSLRDAITQANASAGADTINITATGTIVLASILPAINDTLTINGPGIFSLWISGNNALLVLEVNAGKTLNLSNVGIVYGNPGGGSGGGILNYGTSNISDVLFYSNSSTLGGGGIANIGTLSITNSFLFSNTATSGEGGAIWQGSGTTTISNTYVFSNSAVSDGGAIYNNAGILNIVNSSIYSNTSQGSGIGGGIHNGFTLNITNTAIYANSALAGGGINNFAGRVTLSNTSLFSNSAGSGAGIFNDGFGSIININQSTLSGNIASNGGGAIWNQVGTVALTNTTMYSNSAPWGGGVYHNIGDLNIMNSTFANNNASSGGGGIQSFSALTVTNSSFSGNSTAILRSNGTTTLRNVIAANSTLGNCGGIITNGGNNLQFGGTIANSCGGGIPTTDPKLGPLADNGGSTKTMALCPAVLPSTPVTTQYAPLLISVARVARLVHTVTSAPTRRAISSSRLLSNSRAPARRVAISFLAMVCVRFVETLASNGFFGISTFGMIALQATYDHGEPWLAQLVDYLQGNLDYLLSYVAEQIPAIRVVRPQGTYLVWMDCRKLSLGKNELERLMRDQDRVYLDEGYIFGPEGERFERINIACPRHLLADPLERIKRAVASA